MTSAAHGRSTSALEVTNVSQHGFWLLLDGEELFLPFAKFPWFSEASIAKIAAVERLSADHLYWKALDIDLSIASIRNPDAFPLVSSQ